MKKTTKLISFMLMILTIMCLWAFSANAAAIPVTTTIRPPFICDTVEYPYMVEMMWSGDTDADGHRVFIRENGKWKALEDLDKCSGSYMFVNLLASTEYTFAVRSYIDGKDGTRYWSGQYATITVKTADLGKTTVYNDGTNATSVELSWDEVKGATGYRVLRYDAKKWVKVADVTDKLSYTVTGLESAKGYVFMVMPYVINSKGGVWGDFSNYLKVTTKNPLIAELEATADEKSITLSWDKVEKATGYRVFIRENNKWKALKTLGGTTYTVTGLESDKFYTLCVRAYQKVDGTYNWFPFESFKWATAPSEDDLTVYRIEKYDEIFNGDFIIETTYENSNGKKKFKGYATKNDYMSIYDEEGITRLYNLKTQKEYSSISHERRVYQWIETIEASAMLEVYGYTTLLRKDYRSEITVSIEELDGKKVICESYKDLNQAGDRKLYFQEDTLVAYDIGTTRYYVEKITTDVPTSFVSLAGYSYEAPIWVGTGHPDF